MNVCTWQNIESYVITTILRVCKLDIMLAIDVIISLTNPRPKFLIFCIIQIIVASAVIMSIVLVCRIDISGRHYRRKVLIFRSCRKCMAVLVLYGHALQKHPPQ